MSNITCTKLSATIAPSEHLPHMQNPKFKAHANSELVRYTAGSDNLWLKLTKTMRPNDEVQLSNGNGFNLEYII